MITITKTEHGYSAVRTKDKTMRTAKHTPGKHTELPWAMDYNRNEDRYQLRGKSSFGHFQGWSADGVTTFEEDKANAQFIVTACNWHDEAREALTEIALLCEQADCEADWQDILRRANSALEGLAKAQGKEQP